MGRIFLELILNDLVQDQKQEKEIIVLCSRVPYYVELESTAKQFTKKRDACAELLFC